MSYSRLGRFVIDKTQRLFGVNHWEGRNIYIVFVVLQAKFSGFEKQKWTKAKGMEIKQPQDNRLMTFGNAPGPSQRNWSPMLLVCLWRPTDFVMMPIALPRWIDFQLSCLLG